MRKLIVVENSLTDYRKSREHLFYSICNELTHATLDLNYVIINFKENYYSINEETVSIHTALRFLKKESRVYGNFIYIFRINNILIPLLIHSKAKLVVIITGLGRFKAKFVSLFFVKLIINLVQFKCRTLTLVFQNGTDPIDLKLKNYKLVNSSSINERQISKGTQMRDSSKKVKLVSVSRNIKGKGLDKLIELFIDQKDFVIDIYCDVETYKFDHDTQSIQFKGMSNDVLKILGNYDCFIYLGSYGEGFPRAILEAMFVGLPIVTTNFDKTKKIVDKNGLLVDLNTPNWKGLILDYLRSTDFKEAGKNSRDLYLKMHSNAIIINQLIQAGNVKGSF